MFKKLLLLASLLFATGAWAQNPTCPTRPVGDSTNACASTAFVNNEIAATSNNNIDIFLVIGDSNAVGQGDSAQSPQVQPGMALAYCANGTIVAANDPTCSAVDAARNANTGSMWPAATISYGRKIGLVLTGISSSTQASACDFGLGAGNWQDTAPGSNYALSITAINNALTAYAAAGYTPIFRGIITELGGNDANQIDSSVCTAAQYTTAVTTMVANYRAATIGGTTYPHLQFWLSLVGRNMNAALPDPGFSQIRAAQLAFAASDKNTSIAFADLYTFSWRGLMQAGVAHPTQAGYNIWGTAVGAALIPAIPANTSFRAISANAAGVGGQSGSLGAGMLLQLIGADNVTSGQAIDVYGTGSFAQMTLRRAEGTLQAPTAPLTNDTLGGYSVQSYGATGFTSNQGSLFFQASENHSDSAKGTKVCLFTTLNGAASPACQFAIVNGNIGFGTETNPQYPFVFSQNTTTGFNLGGSFTGIMLVGATGAIPAVNTFGINSFGNTTFNRVNGSIGTPGNVNNTDLLGGITFGGWGNGSLQPGRAQILATATEAWSGSTFGVSIGFNTTQAGGSRAQAMLLKGGVIIGTGTTDPGAGNLGFINLALSGTAPTISAGFCTSPSIPANNGTVAFTINVGSACAASTGTLGMPTAANGWVCDFHDVTTPASNVVEQTGGATNTVTLTNYARTTGLAANFTSSDVIRAKCVAY